MQRAGNMIASTYFHFPFSSRVMDVDECRAEFYFKQCMNRMLTSAFGILVTWWLAVAGICGMKRLL